MIQIGKIDAQQTEGSVRLSADVTISGREETTLWFTLPQRGASSRGDSFVMALLPLAMREGHDIVCAAPVSDRLQYQLNQCLIPAVMREMGKRQDETIQLKAPLAHLEGHTPRLSALKFSKEAAFSAALEAHGRDSLYPLTHLAVWNLEGSRGRRAFQERCREAAGLARQRGLELLDVDSNLGDVLGENLEAVGLYWELASALAVEDLGLYLFCTSRPAAEFKIDPQNGDAYALLLTACSCTETLRVCLFSPEVQAVEAPRGRPEPLVIGRPYLEEVGDRRRLCAQVEMNGKSQVMWISVLEEYGGYLVDDRCDAFVAALLPKALREGRDLVCQGPVSRQLLYQINQYMIPILTANIDTFHPVTLRAEAACPLPTAGYVCTGGTGGVDSTYSIFESLHVPEGSRCKLTHLFLASNGAIERGVLSDTLELMADRARRKIIPGTGLDVLTIDSNLQDLLSEEVFAQVVDFRHTAVLLALQKYFGTVLISSTRAFCEFAFSACDCTSYELLLLNLFSTENTIFYSSGGMFIPKDKLNAIKDFPIARRALHTCIDETAELNCGKCMKCMMSQTLLYAMGKLDNFSAVFDTAAFARRRYRIFSRLISLAYSAPELKDRRMVVIKSLEEAGETLWPAYVLSARQIFWSRLFQTRLFYFARQCKRRLCGEK